ncbi:MAG: group 1 truncated hemoglobin [Chloroflexota bacterium]|nr:group 1 truncated hemoglobin [Chloroflexota bacterium]
MAASLFDRLGGRTAIMAVVADFRKRVEQDSRINAKFARTDLPRLEAMLVDQVSEATGGAFHYTGRDMREAHQGMGVTTGEFNALVDDLVTTLNGFAVPKTEQDELLGILGPLKTEIVEVESSAMGTPLPDAYQAAPPLAKS